MSGSTLFRPEDRLVWYADWLKFLQEREADLRAQLARQEKSARKAEPPPEAEIAFVSDQASFLDIAFGEQASAPQPAAGEAVVDADMETGDDGDADEAPDGAAGAGVFAEAQSAHAGADASAVAAADDGEEPDDTDLATAALAPSAAASNDPVSDPSRGKGIDDPGASDVAASNEESPAVEEDVVVLATEVNSQLGDAPVSLSPTHPLSNSTSHPLSPSPTPPSQPMEEAVAEESSQSSHDKEELA